MTLHAAHARTLVFAIGLSALLVGCGGLDTRAGAHYVSVPASELRRPVSLVDPVQVQLPKGTVNLPAGSRWQKIGAIPRGDVYRRVDEMFSLEGGYRGEALPVIQAGQLIGFYLPGERGYLSLGKPVRAPLQTGF
ncbi:Uncharacterised protein [Bordetella ansorpii]|uniref:Uncharacterized protein n=1 Tax=Bordetella ansorpii TaxID=288768 RepID=A0A157M0F8_9BORD|nr:hypothetical protein [Bordetella ansorpii]SAI02174.1 Uncharacterised protein [Bordetella ansorpii]